MEELHPMTTKEREERLIKVCGLRRWVQEKEESVTSAKGREKYHQQLILLDNEREVLARVLGLIKGTPETGETNKLWRWEEEHREEILAVWARKEAKATEQQET